jgi:hypothetical protein
MHDHAEYCGPVLSLVGRRALVKPDETYHLSLEQRTLLAQFLDVLEHPETGALLCRDWHTFPAVHFKLLVPIST